MPHQTPENRPQKFLVASVKDIFGDYFGRLVAKEEKSTLFIKQRHKDKSAKKKKEEYLNRQKDKETHR